MNRQELIYELKRYKKEGLTDIKLTASEQELRSEWLRIAIELVNKKAKRGTKR